MANTKKKGLNTSSNAYTLIYSVLKVHRVVKKLASNLIVPTLKTENSLCMFALLITKQNMLFLFMVWACGDR